ncbi:MAG: carbamoyl phosphate synthase large subunit, partial [Mariprofundaceae bacterium]|nr:carbamoyl phosphate synthase large subunit [Mariprofundaceae bacterium]
LGLALNVKGLMNIQFALQGADLYVLEVNPRASRTVPFVSKATGVPLAKMAARIMSGQSLDDLGLDSVPQPTTYRAVKDAVFPFVKFRGVDPLLSPEMKSTGEVMGIAGDFPTAFNKAQLGGGCRLPDTGRAFISVRDVDKEAAVCLGRILAEKFEILATTGTHAALQAAGVASSHVAKVIDGVRPHIVDRLLSGDVDLIVNTTEGTQAIADSKSIRQAALDRAIPYFTTMAGGLAASRAIASSANMMEVKSIQSYLQYHGG